LRKQSGFATQRLERRKMARPVTLFTGLVQAKSAQEGSEGEEAGKVAVLRTIGGRSTERNVTLLFGAKDAEHNNAQALVAFVRELGGAA
jgi:uncharacterized protein YeaO (DUF488 family)